MEVGAEFIGMVKTNTKIFFKYTIEKLTRDWPGYSYLLLRSMSMVSGRRKIIDVGYKYNMWKVLSFIVIDNSCSTQAGLLYLYHYSYQFTNVSIFPFARPLVMSKFFGAVNEVDSHNKSRQSDLRMDKLWVTQCGWQCLCMAVSMLMTITNCLKLFCYGVKREHYYKLIGIRELSERLAQD